MKKILIVLVIFTFVVLLELSYIQYRLNQKMQRLENLQVSFLSQVKKIETVTELTTQKMLSIKLKNRPNQFKFKFTQLPQDTAAESVLLVAGN